MKDKKVLELEKSLATFLDSIGEDSKRDGLIETPRRYVKQLQECLVGYSEKAEDHIKTFGSSGYSGLVVVKDISFYSLCEHHILPFYGIVHIGYVPNNKVLGLSKFARIVGAITKQLQIQERATKQIADVIEKGLSPKLLIVKMSAEHMCMVMRGIKCTHSTTETLVIRGNQEKYKNYIDQFNQII